MASTVTPRSARIHLNTTESQYRVSASALEFNGTRYTPEDLIKFAFTLADIISALIDFWAPIAPGGESMSVMPAGDMHALATRIIATYPSGYVPGAPTT